MSDHGRPHASFFFGRKAEFRSAENHVLHSRKTRALNDQMFKSTGVVTARVGNSKDGVAELQNATDVKDFSAPRSFFRNSFRKVQHFGIYNLERRMLPHRELVLCYVRTGHAKTKESICKAKRSVTAVAENHASEQVAV